MAYDLTPLDRGDSILLAVDAIKENFTQLVSVYTSTMTGDETFSPNGGSSNALLRKFVLDPNGADRDFDPSGTFPVGYLGIVANVGDSYNVVVDSESDGLQCVVTPGSIAFIMYTSGGWIGGLIV